ncbi:NADH:flavin oxidoreductase/NADH oxidase family protein [Temperatibacter marinus]|uniref:NADH:flavin oxidoreductase/NADH oxidase family protein n=1 Tax=Temperatibacter marinus TaxID=1456591 RepID=A0AA52EFR3_9PROT|nr:NADH:flavin oxidoreductase/NADH oxidase family protein [Temperatibacter marinus]WND03961.1 NADH:flavin oxidoreductase/NADH oxidase family protein [Temperatibacter marinus]
MPQIQDSYILPCGLNLKNRLAKAAMTEGLADENGLATMDHCRLYDLWAKSDTGLLITGNVMVDRFHLERAGNIVIDGPQSDERMDALKKFAFASQQYETACFVQLSHSGRQTPININKKPKSASDVQLSLPGGQYGKPVSLTEAELEALIGKFSLAAKACEEAGFKGVQIHGAHGYLLSQFLSPKSNKRSDRWGGNLENRARLLIEVVSEVQKVTGDGFGVAVKLNSADFQKGGFSFEDCLKVVKWLNALNIDFLEISGGTYEQPKMVGLDGALEPVFEDETQMKSSTKVREAFFLHYATAIQKIADMPLMITGGFRSKDVMNEALSNGESDLIGLARPMVPFPLCTKDLLNGSIAKLPSEDHFIPTSWWLKPTSPFNILKLAHGLGVMGWYYEKLREMGAGTMPTLTQGLFKAIFSNFTKDNKLAKAYKKSLKR